MLQALINYIDQFAPELLVIQTGFLIILSTLFLWLWMLNRKRFHSLKHTIPANVVKAYLDSIIQNSTTLKSSLFRGGGQDLDTSVLLQSSAIISTPNISNSNSNSDSGVSKAELDQKNSVIAALEEKLRESQESVHKLKNENEDLKNKLASAQARIKELEDLLNQSTQGGNVDETIKIQLNGVTKQRDELQERLKEYEIIADDLANLKKLKQENEQLKLSLKNAGVSQPEAPTEPEPDVPANVSQDSIDELFAEKQTPESEPETAPEPEVVATAGEDTSPEEKNRSDKTPDDLLSEFEKMLG